MQGSIVPNRRRLQFSLRSLLLATAGVALVLGVVVGWWTRPYSLTGTHPNGVRGWETWERRTVTLRIAHIRTVLFHSSGQKGYEYADDEVRCWSPEGEPITEKRFMRYFWEEGLDEIPPDQSEVPYQDFLWWWNGW